MSSEQSGNCPVCVAAVSSAAPVSQSAPEDQLSHGSEPPPVSGLSSHSSSTQTLCSQQPLSRGRPH